ncbi:MAG: hypothetical protein DYG88_05920 [Chloroflexi bacterium CFX4]|nr:hypothetical protein [Chloroflexi bacterium CFX4]MDL1922851.1 hypothetical protein [Chloroflexi bacterium CFX3]
MQRLINVTLALTLMLALAISLPATSLHAQQGKILADIGFKPKEHGFAFQNYGNENNPTNLTAVEMIRIFGAERVCAGAVNAEGGCKLTAPAAAFMKKENADMDGGHCEGMAVLSLVFFEQQLSAADFGAALPNKLRLRGNKALQREIAYWFQLQVMDEVYGSRITLTPAEVVDGLIGAFEENYLVTLAFYQPDGSGGHAVTPYAVRQMSDTRYDILIYDNNFPNEERAIEVDIEANTWRYNTAANPNDPPELYEGDETTQSLIVVPLEARYQESFTCSYCGDYIPAEKTGTVDKLTFSLNGEANVIITDGQGRTLRFVDGAFSNDIPDVEIRQVTNQRGRTRTIGSRRAPTIIMPNGKYTVQVSKARGSNPATSFTFAKQGNVLTASKLDLSQSLDLNIDRDRLQMKSAAARSLKVQNTVSANGRHYAYNLAGNGDALTLRLGERGEMRASGSGGNYSLLVARTNPDGSSKLYYNSAVGLRDAGEAEFDPEDWGDTLSVGYYDEDDALLETETYADEPLSEDLLDLFELDRDFMENFDDESEWDEAWGADEEGDFGEDDTENGDDTDTDDQDDGDDDNNGGNDDGGGDDDGGDDDGGDDDDD